MAVAASAQGWLGWALCLGVISLAVLLRLVFPLAGPFITFYPAILFCALIGGLRAGLLALGRRARGGALCARGGGAFRSCGVACRVVAEFRAFRICDRHGDRLPAAHAAEIPSAHGAVPPAAAFHRSCDLGCAIADLHLRHRARSPTSSSARRSRRYWATAWMRSRRWEARCCPGFCTPTTCPAPRERFEALTAESREELARYRIPHAAQGRLMGVAAEPRARVHPRPEGKAAADPRASPPTSPRASTSRSSCWPARSASAASSRMRRPAFRSPTSTAISCSAIRPTRRSSATALKSCAMRPSPCWSTRMTAPPTSPRWSGWSRQEIPYFEIFNRSIHKSGRIVWVHKFVLLLKDRQGRPVNIVALAHRHDGAQAPGRADQAPDARGEPPLQEPARRRSVGGAADRDPMAIRRASRSASANGCRGWPPATICWCTIPGRAWGSRSWCVRSCRISRIWWAGGSASRGRRCASMPPPPRASAWRCTSSR